MSARQTGRSVVDCLIEAIRSHNAFRRKALEIQACLFGRYRQRQRRGIGRNDQIIGEPAFETQAGYAKGAILVVEMNVDCVVAGFRTAPGHPAFPPILDLPGHRRLAGLVEQCVFVRRHHQERHEVFEHRTAPRKEDLLSAGSGQQTSQGEPALLRQLSLRNRYETAKSCFRSQQIVVTRVPPTFTNVVPDSHEIACLVEQKIVFHMGEFVDLPCQPFDSPNPRSGAPA